MEEKFSVSLELMIQKFKDNAKRVQDVSKNVANKIKENMSVNVGGGAFKGATAESELLLNKINDIKATLQMAKGDNKLFSNTEALEMRVELEKLENQYNKINNKSNMFSNSFKKIQDGMKKSLNSAKRFAISLFGIQSVYRMLSRASSSYLAQDEETSSKIQSAWIGLGSIFAPLLQAVANFTIKAVSYINVFIKALTGTDFLANAMAKSMKKANKESTKLSKTLAGFDELTNIDTDTGGATVDTSWLDAFKNVELDPTLIQKITNFGLAVKGIWDKYISPFFKFIKDNWDGVGKDIVGGILLIGMLFDAATGNWIGLILKFVGFVLLYWDDIKGATKILVDFIVYVFKHGVDILIQTIKSLAEMVKRIANNIASTIGNLVNGIVNSVVSSIQGVINGIRQVFNGLIDFICGVFTGNWKRAWQGVRDIFSGIFGTLWSIVKLPLNLIIDGLNAIVDGVNGIVIGGLNKLLELGKLVGIDITIPTIPKIPKLEVGTNFVPNDMMAQIHKGEAVVPKKFNSDEYVKKSDYNNNERVESLLEELIDRVEQIEINPYTTVKDVGSASVNYINTQKRVMGRGVI